ncbi:hypothetical protein CRG98_006728 [Punica granatum]|uniref:Uncharacterized protein n=1 Tax=Punica granatum TaxID=22663 RepID=A0A2I0KX05_PUNGR|nr:hypothetical protein CRG98_006728 [Punica granatum]
MGCHPWGTLVSKSIVITTPEWLDHDRWPHEYTSIGCGWWPQRRADWVPHPSVGGVTMQTTLVSGGLGHALSIGAFGCDLCGGRVRTRFQEAGREDVGERTSLVSIVRARRGTGTGCVEDMCMGKVDACSHDVKGRAQLDVFGCTKSNLSVIDPNVGKVHHGGRARREGCPRRRAACILWRVGEKRLKWHAGRLDELSSKPGWRMAWKLSMMHGFGTTGTVLFRDGGPRLKGVNSLKSSVILFKA